MSSRPPYKHRRHFDLEEARRILPEVRRLLEVGVELRKKLEEMNFEPAGKMELIAPGVAKNGRPFPPEAIQLASIIHRFEELGVALKDLRVGICDFPALRPSGEEVYLCYRLGEPDICFFHGLEEGFAGRRPLEEF